MTSNLVEQIKSLDDVQSVRFLQHFNQMLRKGVGNNFNQLLTRVPSSIREMPEYDTIENVALGKTEAQLTEDESIEISRNFLEIMTQDPAIAPLLEKAWETYTAQMELGAVKTILSLPLAACMMIIVAVAEVDLKVGEVVIHKPQASPELVQAIAGLMVASRLGSKKGSSTENKKDSQKQ